jgi:hypothetical protein
MLSYTSLLFSAEWEKLGGGGGGSIWSITKQRERDIFIFHYE